MLGFPLGIFVANGLEWYFHKVWLHEFPTKYRNSPFFTHIAHHKRARLNNFHDEGYAESMFKNAEIYNEKTALIGLAGAATVFLPVAPFFTAGLYYGIWNYWRIHAKSHLDLEYAKNRIPWHYDHHMTSNQNANWCVTRPWFDYIMGTRVTTEVSKTETNPLGIQLPHWLEKRVNTFAHKILKKSFAKIDLNSQKDKSDLNKGIEVALT
ncbi:sterol desaturase family protein [Acinetobacter baumannii]|uniref:sterol desaturase family protein n=1 Tax=Acinetobacter baumannii TaxID=470 RepID=UPI00112C30D1|nr:sterol desaturase family protein [Acinetobacter baumannii]MCF1332752.1 sterol desaturase family protein [Acinetobacter baumannii]MCP9136694.1 sterol desaturase family protein [Acinetobacter baumannii]MDC4650217.1 sterol desaturase family protein [Acinetobacter baumannii]MDC5187113.1 sterol desaturase family protein [Acinetobacter baumannii]MDC5342027.1 sterol desaturase family protein [Acinetobacter baumannii]